MMTVDTDGVLSAAECDGEHCCACLGDLRDTPDLLKEGWEIELVEQEDEDGNDVFVVWCPFCRAVTGVQLIAEERERHRAEGWTHDHDAHHTDFELSMAAACYAAHETDIDEELWNAWPWAHSWDKRHKHTRIRRLQIAGSLIAAELDRLLRDPQARNDFVTDHLAPWAKVQG